MLMTSNGGNYINDRQSGGYAQSFHSNNNIENLLSVIFQMKNVKMNAWDTPRTPARPANRSENQRVNATANWSVR